MKTEIIHSCLEEGNIKSIQEVLYILEKVFINGENYISLEMPLY